MASPWPKTRAFSVRPMLLLLVLGCVACSQPRVATTQSYQGGPLPRPSRILVSDFAIEPGEVRLDEGLRARFMRAMDDQPSSGQQVAAARKTTAALTDALVQQLRSYGLPAERASSAAPLPGSVLIDGQILSLDQGNRTRRTLIGLGAGASSIEADAQVYYRRGAAQPELLESFAASADSGHMPGAAETMGAGAAAGRLATSAAASGGMHALSERRRTGDDENAENLAKGLAQQIGQFFARQGWISTSAIR
jgi:Domain of unknown function (DUF4410)